MKASSTNRPIPTTKQMRIGRLAAINSIITIPPDLDGISIAQFCREVNFIVTNFHKNMENIKSICYNSNCYNYTCIKRNP